MSLAVQNPETGQLSQVQKRIQAVLVERELWPQNGLRLEYDKPKCIGCQTFGKCTICVQGKKCDSCKESKQHSDKCTKQRICDNCDERKRRCQCVSKKYCF